MAQHLLLRVSLHVSTHTHRQRTEATKRGNAQTAAVAVLFLLFCVIIGTAGPPQVLIGEPSTAAIYMVNALLVATATHPLPGLVTVSTDDGLVFNRHRPRHEDRSTTETT